MVCKFMLDAEQQQRTHKIEFFWSICLSIESFQPFFTGHIIYWHRRLISLEYDYKKFRNSIKILK